MLVPESPEVLWIVILSFIVGFFLAFGVGANDVANSFGTSVGSKVLSLRQACILATIMEVLGSVLMGYKVSNTVRTGIFDIEMYSEFEKQLMFGYLSALIGSAIWNIVATFFRWPISGTHSIIGAIVGFSFVSRGFFSVKWSMLGQIVASWFLSPLLSGSISVGIFLIVRNFILNKESAVERGYISLPFFWGFTIFINIFSTVHNGPSYLFFDKVPWWGVCILSLGFGIICGLIVWYCIVPHLRKSKSNLGDSESSENQIANTEVQLKLPYPEAENPCFDESGSSKINFSKGESPDLKSNGNDIPLQDIMNNACNSNQSVYVIEEDLATKNNSVQTSENKHEVDTPEIARLFSSLQILTAIFASFAHGANDVSNAIGPVVAIWMIYRDGLVYQEGDSPFWIMLYGGLGISIGLWMWGRKVIKTIGEDLTKITPSSGFCIEIGAATTVLLASKIGLPISTTHCKVGSVVFVGWVRSKTSVDWKLFRNIILAWVLTLPVSAAISAVSMAILLAFS